MLVMVPISILGTKLGLHYVYMFVALFSIVWYGLERSWTFLLVFVCVNSAEVCYSRSSEPSSPRRD